MRKITFPRVFRRTYGANRLPVPPGPPDRDAGVSPGPLHPRGNADVMVRAGSRRIIDRDSGNHGRSFLSRTADELNSGPTPNRIDRGTTARNSGTISHANVAGWPYDGNALYIPHQAIPRKPITVSPFVRTIDTSVTIPSIGIGNPIA
jgi:hypothetical protein